MVFEELQYIFLEGEWIDDLHEVRQLSLTVRQEQKGLPGQQK